VVAVIDAGYAISPDGMKAQIESDIISSGEAMDGAGEPGTPPMAPALANAILNASGNRIRQLPIKHSALDV